MVYATVTYFLSLHMHMYNGWQSIMFTDLTTACSSASALYSPIFAEAVYCV